MKPQEYRGGPGSRVPWRREKCTGGAREDACPFKADETGENKCEAVLNGACISSKYSITNEMPFLKSR